MQQMAKEVGKRMLFLLNKVNGQVEEALARHMDGMQVVAKIPQDKEIFLQTLEGKPLTKHLSQINELCDWLCTPG